MLSFYKLYYKQLFGDFLIALFAFPVVLAEILLFRLGFLIPNFIVPSP